MLGPAPRFMQFSITGISGGCLARCSQDLETCSWSYAVHGRHIAQGPRMAGSEADPDTHPHHHVPLHTKEFESKSYAGCGSWEVFLLISNVTTVLITRRNTVKTNPQLKP